MYVYPTYSSRFANILVVNVFVGWLYTQRLPSTNEDWAGQVGERSSIASRAMVTQLKTYVFADRILASAFRRACYDHFVQDVIQKDCVYYETVIYAYEHLAPDNRILQLLVEVHCRSFVAEEDKHIEGELEKRNQLPYEFLMQVMIRYSSMKSRKHETKPLHPPIYFEDEVIEIV